MHSHEQQKRSSVYQPGQVQAFLVDNGMLQARTRGLGLRRTPHMDDMDEDVPPAAWGAVIYGRAFGNEWVKVEPSPQGQHFLPTHLDGVRVLIPFDIGEVRGGSLQLENYRIPDGEGGEQEDAKLRDLEHLMTASADASQGRLERRAEMEQRVNALEKDVINVLEEEASLKRNAERILQVIETLAVIDTMESIEQATVSEVETELGSVARAIVSHVMNCAADEELAARRESNAAPAARRSTVKGPRKSCAAAAAGYMASLFKRVLPTLGADEIADDAQRRSTHAAGLQSLESLTICVFSNLANEEGSGEALLEERLQSEEAVTQYLAESLSMGLAVYQEPTKEPSEEPPEEPLRDTLIDSDAATAASRNIAPVEAREMALPGVESREVAMENNLRRDTRRVLTAVQFLTDVAEEEEVAFSNDQANPSSESAELAAQVVEQQVLAVTRSVLTTVYANAKDEPEAEMAKGKPRQSCVQHASRYIAQLTQKLVQSVEAETDASAQTSAPDVSLQVLDAVAENVFADLALTGSNSEEIVEERRITSAFIQQALTELALLEETSSAPPVFVEQEAAPTNARRMSAFPLSSPQGSDAGAAGSRRSSEASAQETQALPARRQSAVPLSSPQGSDRGAVGSRCSSVISVQEMQALRDRTQSAVPLSSPRSSGAGGVGSRRSSGSVAASSTGLLRSGPPANIEPLTSEPTRQDSKRPSNIEPLMSDDRPRQSHPGGDADLQQLLAESRQTRRSTVKLLGEKHSSVATPPHASAASSQNTVLLEAPEKEPASDVRRSSKQEAATSFIAALMQKAIINAEAREASDEEF